MATNNRFFKVFRHRTNGRYIFFDADIPYSPDARARSRFLRKLKPHMRVFEKGMFGTLTYNRESLPVKTKHISSFFTRTRAYTRKHEGCLNRCNDGSEPSLFYAWRLDVGEKYRRPHFHFLANIKYIPKKEIARMWGKGYVDPKRIYSVGGAMFDIGKYVGKSCHRYTNYDLSGVGRSFGTSRNVTNIPSEWVSCGHYREDWALNFCLANLKAENKRIKEKNQLVKYL